MTDYIVKHSCWKGVQSVGHSLKNLVPRPPLFLPSICIHIDTWKQNSGEKQGRTGLIHHVNDIRWTRGGHRGRGAQLQKQHNGLSVRAFY